jgi:hypothetical protein
MRVLLVLVGWWRRRSSPVLMLVGWWRNRPTFVLMLMLMLMLMLVGWWRRRPSFVLVLLRVLWRRWLSKWGFLPRKRHRRRALAVTRLEIQGGVEDCLVGVLVLRLRLNHKLAALPHRVGEFHQVNPMHPLPSK